MIELGIEPERLGLHLTTGADFTSTLTYQDETGADANWPAGSVLTLVFNGGGTAWAATITGADATFAVDKATSDAITDGTAVSLVYTNGTTDDVWARGTVKRHD